MRWIVFAAALVMAGCEAQVAQDDFVPIRQLVAEIDAAGTPYECAEYDAASQTCESIATLRIEGDTLVNEGTFRFSDDSDVTARGLVRMRIEGGRACGNLGDTDFSGFGGGEFEEFLVGFLKAAFAEIGDVCFGYYRLGDGRYLSEGRLRSGELLPDGQQEVRFVAEPLGLRAME